MTAIRIGLSFLSFLSFQKSFYRYRISNVKSQIPDLKSQISNLKSQISNLRSQISKNRQPKPAATPRGPARPMIPLLLSKYLSRMLRFRPARQGRHAGPTANGDSHLGYQTFTNMGCSAPFATIPACGMVAKASRCEVLGKMPPGLKTTRASPP
jgi:hypothetical protein